MMSNQETDVYLFQPKQTIHLNQKYKLRIVEVKRQSPQIKTNYVNYQYSDGNKDTRSVFDTFVISLECRFYTHDNQDYHVKLDEYFEDLFIRDSYYLWHSKTPGKRYLVHPVPFEAERYSAGNSKFTLNFEVFPGHSESLGTTLSPFTLESEKWQIGQGVLSEDHQYIHTKNHIQIYNGGSFEINPRMHELKITIQTYSQGGFKLTNRTTGEMFKFNDNERLYDTDTVVIDGPKIYKNGIRCGRLTNLGLISLAPGMNEIDIDNVSRVKTSWDFRFLYK